jgi:hypothetical protein
MAPHARLSRYLVLFTVVLPTLAFGQTADAESLSGEGRQPGELERI